MPSRPPSPASLVRCNFELHVICMPDGVSAVSDIATDDQGDMIGALHSTNRGVICKVRRVGLLRLMVMWTRRSRCTTSDSGYYSRMQLVQRVQVHEPRCRSSRVRQAAQSSVECRCRSPKEARPLMRTQAEESNRWEQICACHSTLVLAL